MMDALFRLPNNDLSAALQKDKLFKEVEQQWNTVSSEEGNSRRKVDYEIYKSIVYNLEVRKVFLDPKLSLVKFSSIVGTNTTYLSNVVNHYFKCNYKHLLNKYRILHAKHLIDNNECAITELDKRCGFTSRSVFYDAFGKIMGIPPAHYRKRREKAAETCSGLSGTMENSLGKNEIHQQQVI